MTVVLAACTFCGDVTLRPDELVVVNHTDRTVYEFDCPVCETPMERNANPKILTVLLAIGVDLIEAAPLPARVREAIDDSLMRCRQTATYEGFMAGVETPADMGFFS